MQKDMTPRINGEGAAALVGGVLLSNNYIIIIIIIIIIISIRQCSRPGSRRGYGGRGTGAAAEHCYYYY